MDRLQGTDLTALHQAIVAVSAAAFPGVHFEFYREDRVNLPLGTGLEGQPPRAYALLELTELDPGDMDPGTEQQAMVARFQANFVVRGIRTDSKVAVRALAGSYAAFLRKQSRFQPDDVLQGAARVLGCFKDDFEPELDQFEVWRVDWTQEVWLGVGTPWLPDPTITPATLQVFVGFEPLVGPAYKDEYIDATAGVPPCGC